MHPHTNENTVKQVMAHPNTDENTLTHRLIRTLTSEIKLYLTDVTNVTNKSLGPKGYFLNI